MTKDVTDDARRSWKALTVLFLKVLGILIPAVVTSYFSYRQAIFELHVGSASTKNQAQAGYTMLVEAVEKTGKAIDEIAKEMAKLEGRLLSMEARLNTRSTESDTALLTSAPAQRTSVTTARVGGVGRGSGSSSIRGTSLPVPSASEPKKVFKSLPKTLDEAVQVQSKR